MDLFKIDQEIKILLKNDDELQEFDSKIYSVSDDEITILGDSGDEIIPLKVGSEVEILFTQPDAFYTLQTTIFDKIAHPTSLFVIKDVREKIQRSQRRRFFRVATRLQVAFVFIGLDNGKQKKMVASTFTKNISGGGLYCYIQNPLMVGELLPLEVFLPDEKKPIVAKGRIVRKDELKKPDVSLKAYGFNFEKINELDRAKIIKYLNRLQSRINPR
ncbi:MAG: PilZ domain-containing protein [Calditrichaeota bacterium]|nr:MAG: PilZ domain-containing protein [Calditrichota bacterium]